MSAGNRLRLMWVESVVPLSHIKTMTRQKLLILFSLPLLCAIAGSAAAAPEIARGKLEEKTLFDSTYHRARRILVYTPPGYSATKAGGYDLLVAFDGYQHVQGADLPAALDSLLAAGKTGPFVGVFVDDSILGTRLQDLANQPRMVGFVGGQLMRWVRAGYNVTRDPHRSLILGSSAGGLEAAHVALERPDLFGNVISQSGAFWRGPLADNGAPYEWLTDQYKKAPKKDIRFVIDVGAMETAHVMGGAGPVMIEANRRFRDVLLAKGYEVTFTEVPNGHHDPRDWEARLPQDIVTIVKGWPPKS